MLTIAKQASLLNEGKTIFLALKSLTVLCKKQSKPATAGSVFSAGKVMNEHRARTQRSP